MDRKVAIVTGGSRGIGAATARCLTRDGWAVAINYRENAAAAEELAAEIGRDGGETMLVQADTAAEADVTRLFDEVAAKWGRLDGLVNNAGIVGPRGRLEALSLDAIERVLAVNVTGYMLCARAAVQRMSTKHGGNGGVIVNVSSGAAHRGGANDNILYAVSKGAVNSLTIGLSQEVAGEGIRVNTVAPRPHPHRHAEPRRAGDPGPLYTYRACRRSAGDRRRHCLADVGAGVVRGRCQPAHCRRSDLIVRPALP